ncbi:uncharacterized protein LOC123946186 [Meles meles]|uniref:uncharacterized protein LOC123946186 n=1 Tax=Meles meles TaxID=9662 RepID=UPI001E69E666|nr:uncharacterized protein LOC123946186 [Meles meles]
MGSHLLNLPACPVSFYSSSSAMTRAAWPKYVAFVSSSSLPPGPVADRRRLREEAGRVAASLTGFGDRSAENLFVWKQACILGPRNLHENNTGVGSRLPGAQGPCCASGSRGPKSGSRMDVMIQASQVARSPLQDLLGRGSSPARPPQEPRLLGEGPPLGAVQSVLGLACSWRPSCPLGPGHGVQRADVCPGYTVCVCPGQLEPVTTSQVAQRHRLCPSWLWRQQLEIKVSRAALPPAAPGMVLPAASSLWGPPVCAPSVSVCLSLHLTRMPLAGFKATRSQILMSQPHGLWGRTRGCLFGAMCRPLPLPLPHRAVTRSVTVFMEV